MAFNDRQYSLLRYSVNPAAKLAAAASSTSASSRRAGRSLEPQTSASRPSRAARVTQASLLPGLLPTHHPARR